MRITRRPPVAGVPGIEEGAGIAAPALGSTPGAKRTGETTGGPDRVDVSQAARLLQRLRAEIGDLDTIASDRVEDLRAQLAADLYRPAPQAVAERLLAELTTDLVV
jgi:hypothetical protein